MSAQETLAALPVAEPNSAELVLAFAENLPKEAERWAAKNHLLIEPGLNARLDVAEIRARGARFVIIDLDDQLDGRDPVELAKDLCTRVPGVAIIALSSRSDPAFAGTLIDAGVAAVVTKRAPAFDLIRALEAAVEKKTFVSGRAQTAAIPLTGRERQVLDMVASGRTNVEIGKTLAISVKTVEAHRARIFKKLDASNAADAVMHAVRAGLLVP